MIKYICDGCGKEQPGSFYKDARRIFKPSDWFERADEDGEQHACSRECIVKVAKTFGKTDVVLPL